MARADTSPDVASLDATVDHVRGPAAGHLVLEYGDYMCPHSRAAFRAVQDIQRTSGDRVRFAFRHFPVIELHPHALAASRAAEAAARQERFWEMSELLFDRQEAFVHQGPRRYAAELGLDLARFDNDRTSRAVLARVRRDVELGLASGQVQVTPTVFIDGILHRGLCDTASLLDALRAIDEVQFVPDGLA